MAGGLRDPRQQARPQGAGGGVALAAAGLRGLRSGFTLVEPLVVLGIITLLVGITVPTLRVMREEARSTECRTTLRELGLALSAYRANMELELQATDIGAEVHEKHSPCPLQCAWPRGSHCSC